MPSITSTNLANAIVKLVAADALPVTLGNLTLGNLAKREFEPVVGQVGESVKTLTHFGALEIPLAERAEATFQIPDVTKVIAVPDLLKLYMQPAIVTVAEKIEQRLFALARTIRSVSVDSFEDALKVEGDLFGVDRTSMKFMVVHPGIYSTLRAHPKFIEYSTAGEAGLRLLIDGPVAKLANLYVFRMPGANPGEAAAFCRGELVMVTRRVPQPQPGSGVIAEYAELGNFGMQVSMGYKPNTLAQQFTLSVLFGAGVFRRLKTRLAQPAAEPKKAAGRDLRKKAFDIVTGAGVSTSANLFGSITNAVEAALEKEYRLGYEAAKAEAADIAKRIPGLPSHERNSIALEILAMTPQD